MSARFWGHATAAKIALGFALAAAAPVVAIVADRARVYRDSIRIGGKR
jgi:tRNA A37 N6-isopentenylltransferase MiaA